MVGCNYFTLNAFWKLNETYTVSIKRKYYNAEQNSVRQVVSKLNEL